MGKTLAICRRAVLLPGELLPERFRAPGRHHVSRCCRRCWLVAQQHVCVLLCLAVQGQWVMRGSRKSRPACQCTPAGRCPQREPAAIPAQGVVTRVTQPEPGAGGYPTATIQMTDIMERGRTKVSLSCRLAGDWGSGQCCLRRGTR